jgi:nucleoside-diphosphate-sugar epimerase
MAPDATPPAPPAVLVTGGTGFLGLHLARTLAGRSHRVVVPVREGSPAARVAALEAARVRIVALPTTPEGWAAVLRAEGVQVVCHLATLFRGEHGPADVAPLVEANVTVGAVLLEGMRLAGDVALVAAGSAWEHHENRDYSPVSLYAATKGAFDAVLAWYVEVAGVRAITLDLCDMYGPEDPRRKLATVLLDAAADGSEVQMNEGAPYIDLLHVEDAVAAMVVAAARVRGLAPGTRERWSVRGGAPRTLRDLVAVVEAVTGRTVRVRWGARPYRAREAFAPWTSGQALPGWAPRVPVAEGLRRLWGARAHA